MSGAPGPRTAFVTVGTTAFDALVVSVTQAPALKALAAFGIERVLVQYGRGAWPDGAAAIGSTTDGVKVEAYSLKTSTVDDVAASELVICHGGAGSIFDAIRAGKPVVVVVNDELMGNHQEELTRHLKSNGHIKCCRADSLAATLAEGGLADLAPVPPSNPTGFLALVDHATGLEEAAGAGEGAGAGAAAVRSASAESTTATKKDQ